jgi:hypothetical protein
MRDAARSYLRPVLLLSVLVALPLGRLPAQSSKLDARIEAWVNKLDSGRKVVDRVVLCFDEESFLEELGKWGPERFWPVLLWESELCDKFITRFAPKKIRLRRPRGRKLTSEKRLSKSLATVQSSWSSDNKNNKGNKDKTGRKGRTGGKGRTGRKDKDAVAAIAPEVYVKQIQALKRSPIGLVLIAKDSPELLGGIAIAAGRFQVPIVFETEKKHNAKVSFDEKESYRKRLRDAAEKLGIAYEERFDELDLITVANDMPFGYTQKDSEMHGGGYTIDDAIARNDEHQRWAWIGRLAGGAERSVYMAMCSLFLQPDRGLFFSRYNSKGTGGFAAFDPSDAPETLAGYFESDVIRHPDATLERWRAHQWPLGNRYGYVFVNSSGGATGWSTSKGGATQFDIPDSVPCVVHYTHSGSAGRPFDDDTIAGRWLANGAYCYFGSYAEPYLAAFVPPNSQATRIAKGLPLSIASRHFYDRRFWTQRKPGKDKEAVRFNVSAEWKLAFFGDPAYRLSRHAVAREQAAALQGPYYPTTSAFLSSRPRQPGARHKHALAAIGVCRLPGLEGRLVDARLWRKSSGRNITDVQAAGLRLEMLRNFVTRLRRAGPTKYYQKSQVAKLAKLPKVLETLIERKAGKDKAAKKESWRAARLVDEFAKEYVAGRANASKPMSADWILDLAARLEHSKAEKRRFEAWRKTLKPAKKR